MDKENKPTEEDFSQFFLEEHAVLDIELPNGDPMMRDGKPVRAHLRGPSTPEFKRASEKVTKAATRRAMQSVRKKNSGNGSDDETDIQFLVAVTVRIENFPYPGGAEGVFRQPRLSYIGNQINAHLNDLGNFFGNGKES